jgi:hypothetical protein
MVSMQRVAIIGAGPVGLAAAAHALERGLDPVVLEAGDRVGAAVQAWSHVRMFSPWKYNVDAAAERLLRAQGWNAPNPDDYPTGGELIEHYLEPLAKRTLLAGHVMTGARVTSIARQRFDKVKSAGREKSPFEIRYVNGNGPSVLHAAAVIDASGTWNSPNPAGANGLVAVGEDNPRLRIAYGMPDVLGASRHAYAGKTVAVLGAAIRPSEPSSISCASRASNRQPRSSGYCGATIQRNPSAVVPMTNSQHAEPSANNLRPVSATALYGWRRGSKFRT